jgi:hypothetical protein
MGGNDVISLLNENYEKSNHQRPNLKWSDKPFGRLTVLSNVEGLTTLSRAKGQIPMIHPPRGPN